MRVRRVDSSDGNSSDDGADKSHGKRAAFLCFTQQ